jgi:hypothetical protein
MIYSRVSFTYNGGPQVFPTNFALGVLTKDHIKVYVNGQVDGLGAPIEYAFTYNSGTGEVTITTALTIGWTGTINRTVPIDTLFVDFENNADVTKRNLSLSTKQVLMAVQEAADGRQADSDLIIATVAETVILQQLVNDTVGSFGTAIDAAQAASDSAAIAAVNANAAAVIAADAAASFDGTVYLQKTDNLGAVPNKALARANLGLVLQSTLTDTTAGRIVTTGGFGLGGLTGLLLGNINATNTPTGLYRYDGTTTGTKPPGAATGSVTVINTLGTTSSTQLVVSNDGFTFWTRACITGTWTAWRYGLSYMDRATGPEVRAGVDAFKYTTSEHVAPRWKVIPFVAATGAAIDFTSLPSGITDIEIRLINVGASAVSQVLVQLGTGGVPTATGYLSTASVTGTSQSATNGFITYLGLDTNTSISTIRISRFDANTWSVDAVGVLVGQNLAHLAAGRVILAGELDNIRVSTLAGSFNRGSINMRYR